MADALISPAVGGTLLAITGGLLGYSGKIIRKDLQEKMIPLMGVAGAFVFAAQMVNFTIPGTGSSGHIGGGLLLAILLGPWAGFLVMASILVIQAFFFADGGLLALGCNIFNMGFWACFICYPLIYRPLAGNSRTKAIAASIIAAVVGLQLGSFSVVLETLASGITDLPFKIFVSAMQPIHLAIGIIEGMVTAAVVVFVRESRPEILNNRQDVSPISLRYVSALLFVAAILVGGFVSWFASENPDGLEWSMHKVSGKELELPQESIHISLSKVQENTAFLPDYGFKADERSKDIAVQVGTSISGIVGGLITLALAMAIGFIVKLGRMSQMVKPKETVTA